MAHTHDQTLLARLGFADPDRSNPMHEDACRFLCTPTGMELIAFGLMDEDIDVLSSGSGTRRTVKHDLMPPRAERERTLSKGTGTSRFTVGFLDVVVHCSYRTRERVITAATGKVERDKTEYYQRPLVIEVKIQRENIGQLLRQVNLYRDFLRDYARSSMEDLAGFNFVVATRYLPTTEEMDTLADADIRHVLLGRGFDEYLQDQAENTKQPRYVEL